MNDNRNKSSADCKNTLVVDILCWRSLLKIIKARKDLDTVYYCSISRMVSKAIRIMSFFFNMRFESFSFASSMLLDNKISCYEETEKTLTDICNKYLEDLKSDPALLKFCRENELDPHLAGEHLRQNVYWILYRPVEILVKSRLLGNNKKISLILRNSPVSGLLFSLAAREGINIILYSYFGIRQLLVRRQEYIFDLYYGKVYLDNELLCSFRILIKVLLFIINSFLGRKFESLSNLNKINSQKANIGVDKYFETAKYDFFWFKDSNVCPDDIYYFEQRNLSSENIEFLRANKIRRVHVVNNPIEWFEAGKNQKQCNRFLISADWSGVGKSIPKYLKQWIRGFSFDSNKEKWQILKLLEFQIYHNLWTDVFKKLNIKLFFSLADIDALNAAKYAALNVSGGLVLGGHVSNNPVYDVQTERLYDVVFAWGPHFHTHLFRRLPYKAVIYTGYYFDFEFSGYKKKAEEIRAGHPDKFIITFMENVFSGDIAFSKETIKAAYNMLFEILDSNPEVILFVKAKNILYFNRSRKIVPRMEHFIANGRMVPFVNSYGEDKPYRACMIALASDLTVGLGISTAAVESQLSGITSFHLDLIQVNDNKFAKNGLGKVVFHFAENAKKAILKQMDKDTKIPDEIIRSYYRDIDPYQDGLSYKRVGNFIRNLQHSLNEGFSREEAIDKAENLAESDKCLLNY